MMKKYILLIAILLHLCRFKTKSQKLQLLYGIQDEEETYMIGSDDTTDFIKKFLIS